MAVSSEFREAVESGKMMRVRIMLKDIMLVEPSMNQFDEMLTYALSNMSNLYDKHDGEKLEYDRSQWSEAYLNKQMVTVVNNFSKERVELLRNMVRYIYRDRVERMSSSSEYQSKATITRTQAGIGVTATGAVVAAVGICAHQGVLIAGGVVIAAVGVGMILTDREN